MDLKKLVKDKIAELGEKAPEFFGKKQSTLDMWGKTGNIPTDAVQKVLDAPEPQTDGKVITPTDLLQRHDTALGQIIGYLNTKAIPFLEKEWGEFKSAAEARIQALEDQLQSLYRVNPQQSNGAPTLGQLIASDAAGNPGGSLTRPSAQTIQTFTEPVGGGMPRLHPLDSGIAPTAEQVAQSQSNAGVQGVGGGQAPPRLAGPAVAVPGAESMGTPGWNKPWPKKG
jgi:hypothetical protein